MKDSQSNKDPLGVVHFSRKIGFSPSRYMDQTDTSTKRFGFDQSISYHLGVKQRYTEHPQNPTDYRSNSIQG
jgi:histone deacetylase complex regulatory component SIN3